MKHFYLLACLWAVGGTLCLAADPGTPIASAESRFGSPQATEVPDYQRHVLPLLGRMGCNGRACHGSFQGQGGFRLSLFGYDFKTDHDALLAGDEPRTNLKAPRDSLILQKPTLAIEHGGGKRMEPNSWQYRLLLNWITAGAPTVKSNAASFDRLEVTPQEIVFKKKGETTRVQVIAHWSDGSREIVTPLCRFRTNDESVAEIDEAAVITAAGPGDTHIVAFYENGVAPIPVLLPVTEQNGARYPVVATPTKIDELIVNKLRKLGVVPSAVCSDEEFLRRVSLDMTGTLPAATEVLAFTTDRSPDKRARKIDELLARPAYAAWWATKLCDITGNNESNVVDKPIEKQITRQWYEWLHARVRDNVPYDQIVEGIVLATSRKEGESYRDYALRSNEMLKPEHLADFAKEPSLPHYWSRRTLRAPEERSLSFSYAFLGVRLQCAQCHKHPFDQWTQDDFQSFTAFFTGLKTGIAPDAKKEHEAMLAEMKLGDLKGGDRNKVLTQRLKDGQPVPVQELFIIPNTNAKRTKDAKDKAKAGRVITPKLLGGDEVLATQFRDPRAALMEWMRDPNNPYFARAFVNRVWSNYFGIGIIEPADDLNLANPPSNKELLDYLSAKFISSGYDMRAIHREICNSAAYQASWKPNTTNELDQKNFSHARLRRLPAEVAYDALVFATGNDSTWQNLLANMDERQIGPRSGVIKQARQGGNYVMDVFGKPTRSTNCDCERSNEPSLLQTVFLRNDREMLAMIDRRDGWVAQMTATKPAAAKSLPGKANPKGPGKAAPVETEATAAAEMATLREQIADSKERLKVIRQKGKKEQVAKAEQRIERLAGRLEHLEAGAAKRAKAAKEEEPVAKPNPKAKSEATQVASSSAETGPQLQGDALIREAYLRTLSRLPTQTELVRCRQYLTGAEQQSAGLRDLLWALLNTKEFMVNH